MLSLNNTLPTISTHQRTCFVSTIFAKKSVLFGTITKNQSWFSSVSQQVQSSSPMLSCRASLEAVHDSPTSSSAVHGLSETVVGVLGGGQLGRMLCEAASQMAIKVIVLDPAENCPASAIAHQHVVGSYDDSATVEEFGKRCGVLTVEIEHVDVATLEKLEQQGVDCQPKASTIRIIQDKYLQKVHFSRHDIPLPKFMQIDNLESARRAGDLFGYPLMIKSRRLAYDGRGNAVAKSEEQLPSAVNALGGYDRGLYVEKWAPFVKELSVIVARGRDNSIACYPAVETIHSDNICHIVKSPANVSWKIMELATDVAHRAVSSLEGAGVFAVELFLTEDGQILLNEVAPRPHNSGHHTIEACFTSQFEQHLRAVVGLPLGDPSMKTPAAVMYNILGEDDGEPGFLLANQLIGRALGIPGASIHWYDKPEMRRQRKMGHITIVGPSMGIVEAQLKMMLNEDSVDGQPAVAARVGIIMGSDSDLPVMKDAAKILKEFDVPAEVKIVSAHRTPEMMFSYALSARERGIQVIIAGAGGAAHLPGMVAALTPLPVIGVPVRASRLDGLDSLLSIVQMPRGVPVATVAINNATNAGLLAVRLLGISDINLQARMAQYQEDRRDEVLVKGERLETVGYEESFLRYMRLRTLSFCCILTCFLFVNVQGLYTPRCHGRVRNSIKGVQIFFSTVTMHNILMKGGHHSTHSTRYQGGAGLGPYDSSDLNYFVYICSRYDIPVQLVRVSIVFHNWHPLMKMHTGPYVVTSSYDLRPKAICISLNSTTSFFYLNKERESIFFYAKTS